MKEVPRYISPIQIQNQQTEQLAYGRINEMKIVHVQSVLPQEDVIALKEKTGESSVKEAISKAVYHYLKCDDEEE